MSTTYVPENGVNPLGDDDQPSGVLPIASGEPSWYTVGGNSASNQFSALNGTSGAFSQASSQSSAVQQSSIPSRPVSASRVQTAKRQGLGTRFMVIAGVLLLLIIVGSISVFASAAPSMFANHHQGQTIPPQPSPVIQQPKKTPTTAAGQPTPKSQANGSATAAPGQTSAWFPDHLPASCSAIGVAPAQAVNANNEAVQFTLREENISFQNVGGLQSSTNLMTPKTKALRFIDDRRSKPDFAKAVQNEQLTQLPSNLQPALQQCQQQAGQTFAWTVVSFNRSTQCATDDRGNACPPNPNFAPEMNQQNKSVVHTMAVLMVMVPKGQDNSPLWLGWAVVDYMIDEAPALPALPPVGQV